MLALLRKFDLDTYQPRTYVVAETDRMSAQKAAAFEGEAAAAAAAGGPQPAARGTPSSRRAPRKLGPSSAVDAPSALSAPPCSTVAIPRSREVGQSFRSSVGTTLGALWHAVRPVLAARPDLLLVNGPGTCVPVVAGALVARALGLARARIVYVESVARVRRLSLTGQVLYRGRLADEFLVQWEELREAYPRAVFAGRLM